MSIFNRPLVTEPDGLVTSANAEKIYDYLRQNLGRDETTCFTENGDDWGISMVHITQTVKEAERIEDEACALMASESKPVSMEALVAELSSDIFDVTYIEKIIQDICINLGNIDNTYTWTDYVARY